MEYEELKILKQSDKSTVHLVREKDGEQIFIRKKLKGIHSVYKTLQNCTHPFLPQLYEVVTSDDSTTIIEEYIEGSVSGSVELSEKQFLNIVKELCSVLEFLHREGIIHRDIKPSNIICAKDGHIRLIDFDAARMPKDNLEQDTRLLGTRGYAPPEQYGFSQTDERSDIYSLGVTLEQLLGKQVHKPRYKRIIQKCTDLNPNKRYQSIRQVKRAFFHMKWRGIYACIAILLIIVVWSFVSPQFVNHDDVMSEITDLDVLPAPENPHWDGETGIALWEHVHDSGIINNEEGYRFRLYRKDTDTPPNPNTDEFLTEGTMSGNLQDNQMFFQVNFGNCFSENGFYYFAVCADGDEIHYADSPYVMSDSFEYTGESAPALPAPTGLEWLTIRDREEDTWKFYATWDNFDDYVDTDSFDVCVYDKSGNFVMNNIWTKEYIMSEGYGGIRIRASALTKSEEEYRFTVQALTSRPNEFHSSPMPNPPTEEYLSPSFSP